MARVVELVDTRDLKSLALNRRAGSIPAPGTPLHDCIYYTCNVHVIPVKVYFYLSKSALFTTVCHHYCTYSAHGKSSISSFCINSNHNYEATCQRNPGVGSDTLGIALSRTVEISE
jgi:hypothetical protein